MTKIRSYKQWFEEGRQRPEYWTEHAVLDYTIALWAQMQEKEITQAELARRADIAPAMVSRVLGGAHNVTIRTMVRLAHALGLRLKISLVDQRVDTRANANERSVTEELSFAVTEDATPKVTHISTKRIVPLAANDFQLLESVDDRAHRRIAA